MEEKNVDSGQKNAGITHFCSRDSADWLGDCFVVPSTSLPERLAMTVGRGAFSVHRSPSTVHRF